MAFVRAIDTLNTWVGKVFAFLVLPLTAVSMFEVVMRYVFHRPTMWGAQILSILFVPLVVMGGGYVLREQEHVRMDVLYGRWSPRQCAIADAVTFIVFLVFTIMLAWMTIEMAWASVKIGEASWASFHGPIYPKKIALAAATVLLLLQGVAQFVRNLQLVRGENKRADK